MKLSQITDAMLKRMPAESRKVLGSRVMTSEEAQEAYVIRGEGELQKQISSLLRIRGYPFINPPMRKKSQLPPGWPDYTVFLPFGRVVLIECKVGKNNLDPDQIKVRGLLLAHLHEYYLVRTLDEVKAILDNPPSPATQA